MGLFSFFNQTLADKITVDGQKQMKSLNEMIDEIHETFYSEVDRLLADAKIYKEVEVQNKELVLKAERLKKLGFKSAKDVKLGDDEQKKIKIIQEENEQKRILVEAIEYFSQKYPLYKFITRDSVRKICQKYDLIYGDVAHYIGDIPEKNLLDIENFKIKSEDVCYVREKHTDRFGGYIFETNYVDENHLRENLKHLIREKNRRNPNIDSEVKYDLDLIQNRNETMDYRPSEHSRNIDKIYKAPLHIAAPKKDFNLKGLGVEDYEIKKMRQIPDPIVLCPVVWKGIMYFLIVTAWGKEALDEDVVNQKMN